MVNLKEQIILNKIYANESNELILIWRINKLKNMLTSIFDINIKSREYIKFKLDSKVLDFYNF